MESRAEPGSDEPSTLKVGLSLSLYKTGLV